MTDREAMQQAQLEKLDGTLWILNQELMRKQAEIDAAFKMLFQVDKEVLTLVNAAIEAEREACAKVCDEVGGRDSDTHAWDAAAAIRARGDNNAP